MNYEVQKILSWWHNFNDIDVIIKTEKHEFTLEINDRRLPHFLGMQYASKNKLKGKRLYDFIKNKSDNQLYQLINDHNHTKLENVKERIKYFRYFMENLDKAVLVQQTHQHSKLESSFLLVKDEEGTYLQLGIAHDRDDTDYFETFIVRKDKEYFKNTKISEAIISIEKWQDGELIPFSFKMKEEKQLNDENIIEQSVSIENTDYWKIEFNEVSGNQKSYSNQVVTLDLLDEIRQLDEKWKLAALVGDEKHKGYSKFYFEHYVDGILKDKIRIDVGDGAEVNAKYFDYIESNLEKDEIKDRKLDDFELSLVKEFSLYIENEENEIWEKGFTTINPYNLTTDKNYQGLNDLKLKLFMIKNGLNDPRFATYYQANKKGFKIIKGSKAIPIKHFVAYDSETNQPFNFEKLQELPEDEKIKMEERLQWRVVKHNVFHARDIEGLAPYEIPNFNSTIKENIELQKMFIKNCFKNMALKFQENIAVDYANYNPIDDVISMPHRKQYKSDAHYFGTMLHEIVHAAGHETRLNRDLSTNNQTEKYAKEELVAELSSLFLLSEIGLSKHDKRNQSFQYLKSWMKRFESKPSVLLDAIKEALRAKDYILEKGKYKELLIENQKEEYPKEPTFLFARVPNSDEVMIVEDTKDNYQKLIEESKNHQEYEIAAINSLDFVTSFVRTDIEQLDYEKFKNKESSLAINLKKAVLLSWKHEVEKKFGITISETYFNKEEKNENKYPEKIKSEGLKKGKQKYDSSTIEQLKRISIVDYAMEQLGFHPRKVGKGKFNFEEHDSLIVYENNNTYYRFSEKKGGSIIDFVMEMEQLESIDAIKKLTAYYETKLKTKDYQLVTINDTVKEKELKLPPKNKDNKNVIDYLKGRGINQSVIDEYVNQELIYQDKKFNCCFVGKDENGEIKEINLRGTLQGSTFRGKASGSGMMGVYKKAVTTETLLIAEAVIDAMSYETMHPETKTNVSYLSTNGVNSVLPILEKRKNEIKKFKNFILAFDNDAAGQSATTETKAYIEKNYPNAKVEVVIPKTKDFNEDLKMFMEMEIEKGINLQMGKNKISGRDVNS